MKLNSIERALINMPWRAHYQKKHEAAEVLARLPLLEGADCIELGCGCGYGSLLIRHYTGCATLASIDIDPVMIEKARQTLDNPPKWANGIPTEGIVFHLGDASSIPAEDNSFDAAFHFFLLDHIQNWRHVLSEVHRILKPGGIYAFEDALLPDSPFLLNHVFGHVPIDSDDLADALTGTGFHIDRIQIGKRGFRRCYILARKDAEVHSVNLLEMRSRA